MRHYAHLNGCDCGIKDMHLFRKSEQPFRFVFFYEKHLKQRRKSDDLYDVYSGCYWEVKW